MRVIKRSGEYQDVDFQKIKKRLSAFGNQYVDIDLLSQRVINQLVDGITTEQLDILAAEEAAQFVPEAPEYALLAGNILVSNLHKKTSWYSFSDAMRVLYADGDGILLPSFAEVVSENAEFLDTLVRPLEDYKYDYFGFKTLEKSYLLRTPEGKIMETPQHMLLRVAVFLATDEYNVLDKAFCAALYHAFSDWKYTHATPTLFNAGTKRHQLSSCFLLDMQEDSIDGIFNTLKRVAKISKDAGGVGLDVTRIRASGTYIKGTGGTSNGLVPMLRNFNSTARYVDQGGGKRKGAFAIYLQPWHADVMSFLTLRLPTGKDELRARDLFYALWVPDLFMRRVKEGKMWSLFSPDRVPGLMEAYGLEFERLYTQYEAEGRYTEQIPAIQLMERIAMTQQETGMPYMLYKDTINERSNQRNLGPIRSSNLCAEIVEHTDPNTVAVCNLASISLPTFVVNGQFDFASFKETVKLAVRSLDAVIDKTMLPLPAEMANNKTSRPLGLGVQGLSDVFNMLRIPYDSIQAEQLEEVIFRTMYYTAIGASAELAKDKGCYIGYDNSPAAKGVYQYEMATDMYDGNARIEFKAELEMAAMYGLRNSLLIALMPTASTSQILGNSESFEPRSYNLFVRKTLAGNFKLLNAHMVRHLRELGLWNAQVRQYLFSSGGSLLGCPGVPEEVQDIYKTAYEISQKLLIDRAAKRGKYVCQSQSFNLYMAEPTLNKIASAHMYGWAKGLKTGMYYLRSEPAKYATRVAVPIQEVLPEEPKVCNLDDPNCESCSA